MNNYKLTLCDGTSIVLYLVTDAELEVLRKILHPTVKVEPLERGGLKHGFQRRAIMPNIVLKWNNTSGRENCPLCGDELSASWGMHPFIEGSWTPICLDCLIVENTLLSYLHSILSPMTMDILDHMAKVWAHQEIPEHIGEPW